MLTQFSNTDNTSVSKFDRFMGRGTFLLHELLKFRWVLPRRILHFFLLLLSTLSFTLTCRGQGVGEPRVACSYFFNPMPAVHIIISLQSGAADSSMPALLHPASRTKHTAQVPCAPSSPAAFRPARRVVSGTPAAMNAFTCSGASSSTRISTLAASSFALLFFWGHNARLCGGRRWFRRPRGCRRRRWLGRGGAGGWGGGRRARGGRGGRRGPCRRRRG